MNEEIAKRILEALKENKNGLILANVARLSDVSRVTAKKHLDKLVLDKKARCKLITRTRKKWYYRDPENIKKMGIGI